MHFWSCVFQQNKYLGSMFSNAIVNIPINTKDVIKLFELSANLSIAENYICW